MFSVAMKLDQMTIPFYRNNEGLDLSTQRPNGTEKLKIICVYVPHCWAIRVSTSRAQGRGGRGFYVKPEVGRVLEIISLSISGGWASHLKNIL